MLCLTTGAASSIYTPAIINDLHHLLWPIHNGMLAHTGSGFPPPICSMDAGAAQRGRMSAISEFVFSLRVRLGCGAAAIFSPL